MKWRFHCNVSNDINFGGHIPHMIFHQCVFLYSSTDTVPGPWIMIIMSPPITLIVWKKSYFLKSYITERKLWDQKLCIKIFNQISQNIIITEVSLVLKPTATSRMRHTPTIVMKILKNLYFCKVFNDPVNQLRATAVYHTIFYAFLIILDHC